MNWLTFAHSRNVHRSLVAGFLQLAVLAMPLTIILPARAADDHAERAVKQRVAPTYPELAKRLRIAGVVRVSATVAPSGAVTATKIVSGNQMLSGAAEDAVHKWKFVAAPEESTVEVEVNFALAN
jgi:TonB family protein